MQVTQQAGTFSVEKCAYSNSNANALILSFNSAAATDSLIFDSLSTSDAPSDTVTVTFPAATNTQAACALTNTVTFSDASLVEVVAANQTFKMKRTAAASLTVTATTTIAASATNEVVRTATGTVLVCAYTVHSDLFVEGLNVFYYQTVSGRSVTINQTTNRDASFASECAITSWDLQMPIGTSISGFIDATNLLTFDASHQTLADAGNAQFKYVVSRASATI